MRRSFLILAAGLVASLALSAPSQAGSTLYDASSTVVVAAVGTPSVTSATVMFSQDVSAPITILSGTGLTVSGEVVSGSTVTFTFSPVGPGDYALNFSLYSGSGLALTGATIAGTGTPMGGGYGFVAPATIPEPTSVALLGIGMAGFFAYRRLFKPRAIA